MNILLFGASGTAGGAVLQACMDAPVVNEVRAIVRRPLGWTDAKLWEIVHADFLNYAPVADAFRGVDACLFCLGISVTQVSKEEFVKISHDFPVAAAKMLLAASSAAAFHYISGAGTRAESSTFWSKVKGETENELMELAGAVCWRPAFIDAAPSASIPRIYAAMRPMLRLLKPFRSFYVDGEDLGRAMLQATRENMRRRVIENAEIREIAGRF
ncbi:MAG: NAD(P)H-binding protein [Acidobacteriia bacterium]|nr:NAD(P)H-binding protein [Terriglobia bacterium]